MAYLDDQALARALNRQRILAGLDPIEDIKDVARAPGKVRVTDTPALQVQPSGQSPQVASPQQQAPQNTALAAALGGLLGSGGGIRDMLARLRAEQAKRAEPAGNVVRGADLPSPVAKPQGAQLPDMVRRGQYPVAPPSPEPQPRARHPAPAAPAAAPGEGQSGILARQRADYGAQIAANPALEEKMLAVMSAEEGGDAEARTALAESAFNRGSSRNITSIDRVLDPRYYEPFQNGQYDKHLAKIRSDPAYKEAVRADLKRALGGSNVSNLATDNASGSVARNSATNQTPAWQAKNGEGFFRKDIRPDVHGAAAVKSTKDWHDNTTAAMVDEKPEPAAAAAAPVQPAAVAPQAAAPAPAPQTPAAATATQSPPQWLVDTVGNRALEQGAAPGSVGSVDPQPQLTREAVLAAGQRQLAPGMVEKGNVDLNNRPVVKNPDGSVSTVRSAGFNIDGKETLLPTVSPDGKTLSNDEAVARYRQTGEHLGKFDSVDASNKYGQQLHLDQEQQYAPQPAQAPLAMTPGIGKAAIAAAQPSAPGDRHAGLKGALWEATRTDQPMAVPPPKPDMAPEPVRAPVMAQAEAELPPPTPTPQAPPTLPQGNAPQVLQQAAQTGMVTPQLAPIPQVQTSWEPPPPTPQTMAFQPFGQGGLSPIPWDWMSGWGWGGQQPGGGMPGGIDMGGGWGSGFSGFDFFGGGNAGGW